MCAKLTVYALGTSLLAVMLAAGTASSSRFEAHTTGVKEFTLSGPAEFGSVRGTDGRSCSSRSSGTCSPWSIKALAE